MRLNDIWALKAIDGKMIDTKELSGRQKHPVLEIHLNEMKIFGNDGCNNIFGKIETFDEKAISFGSLGGTQMICQNMEISSKYNSALAKTNSYKFDGLKLYFYDAEGKEVLNFKKVD